MDSPNGFHPCWLNWEEESHLDEFTGNAAGRLTPAQIYTGSLAASWERRFSMNPVTSWEPPGPICPCVVASAPVFCVCTPSQRRRGISSCGHRLGKDTDFPLGPRRRWRRVTLFLLCYQLQTCLLALTQPASALLCRLFKAFAPGKKGKNGSGFSQYANWAALYCRLCL